MARSSHLMDNRMHGMAQITLICLPPSLVVAYGNERKSRFKRMMVSRCCLLRDHWLHRLVVVAEPTAHATDLQPLSQKISNMEADSITNVKLQFVLQSLIFESATCNSACDFCL